MRRVMDFSRACIDGWVEKGRSTQPLDVGYSTDTIRDIYGYAGYKQPDIEVYESPQQACTDYLKYLRASPPPRAGRHSATGVLQVIYDTKGKGGVAGAPELSRLLGEYLYVPVFRALQITHPRKLIPGTWGATRALIKMDRDVRELCTRQADACHIWFPYTDVVFLCQRPTLLNIDEAGRLHNANGAAVAYSDGWSIYAWHGIRVPPAYALEDVTLYDIEHEENQELRRVLLERYGWERYIEESKAKPLSRKDDFGDLYDLSLGYGRTQRICLVVNSSPEPDGSYRKYALLVPRTIDTPKEAVAATFGLHNAMYKPRIQT